MPEIDGPAHLGVFGDRDRRLSRVEVAGFGVPEAVIVDLNQAGLAPRGRWERWNLTPARPGAEGSRSPTRAQPRASALRI